MARRSRAPTSSQLVSSHKPGDKVKVEIVRKKDTKTLTVTLGKRPAVLQTP